MCLYIIIWMVMQWLWSEEEKKIHVIDTCLIIFDTEKNNVSHFGFLKSINLIATHCWYWYIFRIFQFQYTSIHVFIYVHWIITGNVIRYSLCDLILINQIDFCYYIREELESMYSNSHISYLASYRKSWSFIWRNAQWRGRATSVFTAGLTVVYQGTSGA